MSQDVIDHLRTSRRALWVDLQRSRRETLSLGRQVAVWAIVATAEFVFILGHFGLDH